MTEFEGRGKRLDRRKFLTGSALVAAVLGAVAVMPAVAQESQTKPASPEESNPPAEQPKDESKKDQPAKKKLVDNQGREYRICDMCGGNMYKQDNTWTCEQCGYSYTE